MTGASLIASGRVPNTNITFDTAFPNAIYNVQATDQTASASGGTGSAVLVEGSPTTSGFRLSKNKKAYWLAIGY